MHADTLVCFAGFHAVDLDSASVNDLFIPSQVSLMSKSLLFVSSFLNTSLMTVSSRLVRISYWFTQGI